MNGFSSEINMISEKEMHERYNVAKHMAASPNKHTSPKMRQLENDDLPTTEQRNEGIQEEHTMYNSTLNGQKRMSNFSQNLNKCPKQQSRVKLFGHD